MRNSTNCVLYSMRYSQKRITTIPLRTIAHLKRLQTPTTLGFAAITICKRSAIIPYSNVSYKVSINMSDIGFNCFICCQSAGYMRVVHDGKQFRKVCQHCVNMVDQCISCEKNILPGGLRTCRLCLDWKTKQFYKQMSGTVTRC